MRSHEVFATSHEVFWPQTVILLISASQVGRIIVMSSSTSTWLALASFLYIILLYFLRNRIRI
jgi:hypothetical protein